LEPKVPPKISEVAASGGLRRQTAWGYVMSNLVLPGVGTFVAGRRVEGVLQLVVSQIGFALSIVWAALFVRDWIHQGSLPEDMTAGLWLGVAGVALFLLGWLWSAASSVVILRNSRKSGL
jgi:hypothetical protein